MPGPFAVERRARPSRAERSTFADVIRLSAGAGTRPEIGTPSRADWAIVCGESAPLRFGLDTFGSARRRRLPGRRRVARQRRVAPAVRVGLHAAERRPRAARALLSMCRSVVVPAAVLSSLS